MNPHRSPQQTIRAYCHYCVQSRSDADVENCTGHIVHATGKPCPLYEYRMGCKRASVKIMRKFCLQCMGGSKDFVRECETIDCPIHLFWFGKNPARSGKGYFAQRTLNLPVRGVVNGRLGFQNQFSISNRSVHGEATQE